MSLDECPLCEEETLKKLRLDWIQCEPCKQWYHIDCVKLAKHESESLASYHCVNCVEEEGPSVYKRTSKRRKRNIDYVSLNEGNKMVLDKSKHHHIDRFNAFVDQVVEPFDTVIGSELTKQYALQTCLSKPVYIPKCDTRGLEMRMPTKLTVNDVADFVGEDEPIEVMDVLNQNGSPNWTVGLWRDYFNTIERDRDRTRNVISLEISDTDLSDHVKRPRFVEEIDLVDKIWPFHQDDKDYEPKPPVTKYCLMSVKDSFTDFHIDFGGTSVYYTVLSGQKSFLLFPPTDSNLNKYKEWCMITDQNITWFGDIATEGFRVNLFPGDCMIIPSGWIHAVYTPIDTIVIGGNFLTVMNIPMQIKISELEVQTKVPRKFTFPSFYTVMWLTAMYYYENDAKELEHTLERSAMEDLLQLLKLQLIASKTGEPKSRRLARESIPRSIVKPETFLERFSLWVDKLKETDHVKTDKEDQKL